MCFVLAYPRVNREKESLKANSTISLSTLRVYNLVSTLLTCFDGRVLTNSKKLLKKAKRLRWERASSHLQFTPFFSNMLRNLADAILHDEPISILVMIVMISGNWKLLILTSPFHMMTSEPDKKWMHLPFLAYQTNSFITLLPNKTINPTKELINCPENEPSNLPSSIDKLIVLT